MTDNTTNTPADTAEPFIVVTEGEITKAACSDIIEVGSIWEAQGRTEEVRALFFEHLKEFGSVALTPDRRVAIICNGCAEHPAMPGN